MFHLKKKKFGKAYLPENCRDKTYHKKKNQYLFNVFFFLDHYSLMNKRHSLFTKPALKNWETISPHQKSERQIMQNRNTDKEARG